ncbi:FAD-binding oxidoreductase [Picrophilus oshimae]|uniref:(S)-2-hydroxy-acid oxidase chain D n=1 Tax=Picrophilus torridus (strain ATCC 700027 / DSM 9790 / JCM 10055 / NBRC 100828 / KAW 2/3) TaxID=1122961 RepID=Q6L072_PICTO|nr:FAD-binding oxidoreductase [Picrophilus oshimae]AAT43630.1 (S)-2-hydroxy-acid oxidase chain D [Picrophilus oshimae DSM 9789]SMD31257.1 glycolate oxidase [Picrophilus oshimae DSM 9789]
MDIYNDLSRIIDPRIILNKTEEKIPFKNDASYISGSEPYLIVMPENVNDVSKVLKYCNDNNINVVPRSGGTSLTGSSVVYHDGIVIDMLKMNKIKNLSLEDRYVVAEPGVRLDDLNIYLSKYNFFYPPDPASSLAATVGGTLSTNAGGLRAVRYGTTKEWVLGLEIVLPDGSIIRTGEYTLKRSAGYDLTALFLGSEGTLGIITSAVLKIAPLPEKVSRIMAFFKTIDDVGIAVSRIKKSGITPLISEFLDRTSMEAVKNSVNLNIPENMNYMLILDIDSDLESIDRKSGDAIKIIKEITDKIEVTTDKKRMDEIYRARKGLYSSLLLNRENDRQIVVIGDVVFPASELPGALHEAENLIKKYNLKVPLFGHIGDGNLHANIITDADEKSLEKVHRFQIELADIAIKHNGSVSAEHGIGLEKNDLLYKEYRDRNNLKALELMREIKNTIDKNNIMNRGKIFYET